MTAHRYVVGVDPGAKTTGIVFRRGYELLGYWLVDMATVGGVPDCGRVVDAVARVVEPAWDTLVAVEDVKAPNPHLGVTNPAGIIATARLLGWIEHWAATRRANLIVVPPRGHGTGPLAAYPAQLVGAREKTGTGQLRHCRSAWDISYGGEKLWRLQVNRKRVT
ncbi:MAG: hypothetical protein H0V96_02230 [Acidimicrobiia bacterium]|nr:hypothetical protein [Acidimicrobiia bacterium]